VGACTFNTSASFLKRDMLWSLFIIAFYITNSISKHVNKIATEDVPLGGGGRNALAFQGD